MGLFIYFWLFSARICHIKSLKGIPKICLHSAFWGKSINSCWFYCKCSHMGCKNLDYANVLCGVFFFLMTIFWDNFPSLTVVFFISQLFIDRFRELSKCAWHCYWSNLLQWIPAIKNFRGHSHLSHSMCIWRRGLFSRNTMFELKCLTKGREEPEQYGFLKLGL